MQLWIEGFAATGESGPAQLLGSYDAKTLKEVVEMWVAEEGTRRVYYNSKELSYWGCQFFDNELDARKVYG